MGREWEDRREGEEREWEEKGAGRESPFMDPRYAPAVFISYS